MYFCFVFICRNQENSLIMAELELSRILDCDTHYQVLKLNQSEHTAVFTDVHQVRKRYKELAILVHPDKNRAADAEAAFKRLSEAYECLVDETSQRNYLQQLRVRRPKSDTQTPKQKYQYKRKRKNQSKSEEGPSLPKRRRTPEEIWQEFQRQEEELARQQFQAKGFDRVYESAAKRPTGTSNSSSTGPPEEQQNILDSDLDAKAGNWAAWSNPTSKRRKIEVAVEDATASSTKLICCMLCRRKFRNVEALSRHEMLSKLHLANLKAQDSSDGP
ncbi:DnaJ subfamily B member 9 [Phytophthora citrophthora]|uniref:DnaJ subfamily B member 9 n=1 Tax=Phytophthora citrophthora TaxID=4793 RepID=A0AAD9LUQ0_9STRA|nr:DnaJ subfamily B member 9 [Phytophthora citrophthora]